MRKKQKNLMRLSEFKYLINADLYRNKGRAGLITLIGFILINPIYRYTFLLRLCAYLKNQKILRYGAYHFVLLLYKHAVVKYGISIPYNTKIGSGLFIGHYGCIVVTPHARIGKNCNISHGVTIGQTNRGIHKGYPSIGDNVYIGPGAKIIGNVKIGNNVAIGANCVVTKDVADNNVVAGVPAKKISDNGSEGYVNYIDYDHL